MNVRITTTILALLLAAAAAFAEDPYEVEWTAQIGTRGNDLSQSVAVDASGNIYISGSTHGDLGGPGAGSSDAFLMKFDSSGNELWTTQIGTSDSDASYSVAVDASGNAYISGGTHGDLGGPNAGSCDAFLSKFDSSGNLLWTTQIGTSSDDVSQSTVVDASGNAYISGWTKGDLGGPSAGDIDVFLSKFDSSGNVLWTRQIGTDAWDASYSVAVDASGNVYISGETYGDLGEPNAGAADAFLSKFDSSGNELWTRQVGTTESHFSYSVALDASGNAYISGYTWRHRGRRSAPPDAFLSKFDSSGNELWTTQIGTRDSDWSYSVAVDAAGDVYISGYTEGDLGGPNAGDWDAFLVKFEAVPAGDDEPAAPERDGDAEATAEIERALEQPDADAYDVSD